jgi:hypothetical protein
MVAVRPAAVMFGCTVYETSPVPVPLAVLTAIQVSAVAAVQVHPGCVLTVNVPGPPAAPLDPDGGLSV